MINKQPILDAISVYGDASKKFAALTLKDAARYYQDTLDSIKKEDAETLAISAHSLKSILRQAGAQEAADVAYTLEKAGKEKDLAKAKAAIPALDPLYTETVAVISSLV